MTEHLPKQEKATKPLMLTGLFLLAIGALLLLFLAFQLFGTTLLERGTQSTLRQEFHALSQKAKHKPNPTPHAAGLSVTPPPLSSPIAEIVIPSIHLDQIVVEGTGEDQLTKGPGHYINTPLPGQSGNVGVAGHRTTWGHPFYAIDQLKVGDRITLITTTSRFDYKVTATRVVSPSDVSVLDPTRRPSLTLTTCNPRYSATTRLVVRALLSAPSTLLSPHTPPAPATHSTHHPLLPAQPAPPSPLPAVLLGAVLLLLPTLFIWRSRLHIERKHKALPLALVALCWAVLLFFFFAALTPLLPQGF